MSDRITGDTREYEITFEPAPSDEEADEYRVKYLHMTDKKYRGLDLMRGVYVNGAYESEEAVAGIESIQVLY